MDAQPPIADPQVRAKVREKIQKVIQWMYRL